MPQIKHSLENQPPETTLFVDRPGFKPMPLQYDPSALITMLNEAGIKVQYSAQQYSTAQYSAVKYSTVQFSKVM